jgi:histidinol-phosphate aminotransferase
MQDPKRDQRIMPRPEVLKAPSVPHGAPDYEELEAWGLKPEDVIDFSVNGNPYGPPPGVREALQDVPVDRYPDREALTLRRVLSQHLDVAPSRIVAGNGAAELIWLIALAFVRSDDRVLILEPTFGEYARAAALMGARVETWRAGSESDFAIQPEAVGARLQALRPRLAFLCNPNNPTGANVPLNQVKTWADQCPATLFVVDEAYVHFASSRARASGLRSTAALEAENVLTLRSMTKDYALAGLRLGYVIGSKPVVDALVRVRPPWSVNAMAQAAGVGALRAEDYLHQCVAQLHEAKAELVEGLEAIGLRPLPSATHFFLLQVGRAAEVRRDLLTRQVQVRDCTSFGLPSYVRIASRRPEENARLLEALREVLA